MPSANDEEDTSCFGALPRGDAERNMHTGDGRPWPDAQGHFRRVLLGRGRGAHYEQLRRRRLHNALKSESLPLPSGTQCAPENSIVRVRRDVDAETRRDELCRTAPHAEHATSSMIKSRVSQPITPAGRTAHLGEHKARAQNNEVTATARCPLGADGLMISRCEHKLLDEGFAKPAIQWTRRPPMHEISHAGKSFISTIKHDFAKAASRSANELPEMRGIMVHILALMNFIIVDITEYESLDA